MGRAFLFYVPPPRLSEKSRRELKSLYPTTRETTDSQSSEVVIRLLRQSPPRLSEKSRREQKSLYPYTGAATNFQSSLGELLLLRQSPPPQVSARVFSGRISGVCLQRCIRCASQVFACKDVFGAHLRCLQLTGTVIGPVSA